MIKMKSPNFVAVTINIFLWILILLTLGPPLLILWIWRKCVNICGQMVKTNLHPVDTNDTYFSIDTCDNLPTVNAVQIWRIKGTVNLKQFQSHFVTCFLESEEKRRRYLNLYCYLVNFGGYVFKKSISHDDFNIDSHIYEYSSVRTQEIESFLAEWMFKKKFPKNVPLWELMLVPLQDSGELETLLLFKIHHCLADGYSFIHIVDTLTGNSSPYLVKSYEDDFLSKVTLCFKAPLLFINYWRKIAITQDILYPMQNESPQWFISLATLDLKKVKLIRRKTNVHFVVLLMSLMVGALRRKVLETKCKSEIPDYIWTANSLPWPDHPRNTLVNHWTGGVFRIPFRCESPVQRLNEAERFFNNFHHKGFHKLVRRCVINASWCIPSYVLRWGHSRNLQYFRYSNAFASLMLADKEYYLLGNKVKNIYLPLAIKDIVPTSVMFGVACSHSNQIDLSISASSELVRSQTDIDKLSQVYIQNELEELTTLLHSSKESKNSCVINV